MKLHTDVISGITDVWTTVQLPQEYDSMVVVATPVYSGTSTPAVPRIRNASGSTFEIRMQSADGLNSSLTGISVSFIVVEEGTYDEQTHGISLEAVKYNSSITDSTSSWIGEQRQYSQSYTSPVVLGQVMSFNDTNWSTFWSRGSSRTEIAGSVIYTGKHVLKTVIRTELMKQ